MAVYTSQGWRECEWFVRNPSNQWKPCTDGWVMTAPGTWKPFISAPSQFSIMSRSAVIGPVWKSADHSHDTKWMGACFHNGRLVITSTDNNLVGVSTNQGDDFNFYALPDTAQWQPPTVGSNKIVMFASGRNRGVWSNDGYTWYNFTLPNNGKWGKVAWNGSRFVGTQFETAQGNPTDMVVVSSNGATWVPSTLPVMGRWSAIATLGSEFILLGSGNVNTSYHSLNGTSWVSRTLPKLGHWRDAAGGQNMVIAVGAPPAGTSDSYCVYKDGAWSARKFPLAGSWSTVEYVNGLWVVMPQRGEYALISTDGESWTTSMLPSSDLTWNQLTGTPDRIVTVPDRGSSIYYLEQPR